MLVGGLIHEDVIGAVPGTGRHVATVNGRGFDLQASVEGLVDGLAGQNILILVRKARPLPGLTCWNSTTCQSWPSITIARPFFRSWCLPQWYLTRKGISNQRSDLRASHRRRLLAG